MISLEKLKELKKTSLSKILEENGAIWLLKQTVIAMEKRITELEKEQKSKK